MNHSPDSIQLRPKRDDDRSFLAMLYASTRQQEMDMIDWTDEQKRAFLQWQFDAQTAHYDQQYGGADFLIIEQKGVPIGRLYVDRREDEIEVIDIALLPECRGGGLGSRLLQEVLGEAEQSGRRVMIYVENFNPARRLYDRLGFQHVDTNGVYHIMKWPAISA
ncbi:MAG: GNAT family N-acetyltransferase [Acidobacteria bacterium]|nr:GNAT family N-acetyltransferase [Acidobacteriota bacterium]MBV9070850.1 GNAT family N-acetyltransferase [Acidobacteriota bacterium]MBV9184844.1 GNAT family N-acetyltransferase [Acidobacteriota bacterium]